MLSDGGIEYAKTHKENKVAFVTFQKDADGRRSWPTNQPSMPLEWALKGQRRQVCILYVCALQGPLYLYLLLYQITRLAKLRPADSWFEFQAFGACKRRCMLRQGGRAKIQTDYQLPGQFCTMFGRNPALQKGHKTQPAMTWHDVASETIRSIYVEFLSGPGSGSDLLDGHAHL